MKNKKMNLNRIKKCATNTILESINNCYITSRLHDDFDLIDSDEDDKYLSNINVKELKSIIENNLITNKKFKRKIDWLLKKLTNDFIYELKYQQDVLKHENLKSKTELEKKLFNDEIKEKLTPSQLKKFEKLYLK